ncbi:hypothetical protein Q5O14_11535 [Eubacteriaceae bacterium ES2]|nr:hypothetical protein Q5O14_11535 [Eubacteriaceae bacterium ES2]
MTIVLDIRQINKFAEKWNRKFNDPQINYIELVDHFMADDCAALGFDMDCGHSFEEIYGKAAYDCDVLAMVIDEIYDIKLLGSAIYSRWRYFNHWAYTGEEILEYKNRSWFILALNRLLTLTAEKSTSSIGRPKKIRIVSNNICFGPQPQSTDIVEQHLTINYDGRIQFLAFEYGEGWGRYNQVQTKKFKVEKAVAENILQKVASYFSNNFDDMTVTDVGSWEMDITNEEDNTYQYSGSLIGSYELDGVDLSDLIREALEIDDLFVFDGRVRLDMINRITINYHRVTRIKPRQTFSEEIEYVTWDYTEQLIINRETETLEHIQKIGTGCRVSRKYEIEGGIESLLDDFDAEDLFANIQGNPEDVIEIPNETRDYTIIIDYEKSPQRSILGTFDKNGLPDDFEEFVESVYTFIRFYGLGEIFDPSVYGKVKRRESEYIFCSVTFDEGYKSYYYLTDDDSIKIGDLVLVPAGKDNHTAIVEVVKIEYFSEENAPLPIEKTKQIIRKCTDDDFDF